MHKYDVQKEVTDKYSLRGRVFSKLREDILKGKYEEDEAIKETQISMEMGVSRTPVREAMRQLELEGLVNIIPNKGAFVTGITAKDIQDIYAIRSLIEGLSAKWAAQNATEEQIQELEEIIELTEFYLKKGNFDQLGELDTRFHEVLYEASNSRTLKHVLSDFHNYVRRVRQASISTPGRGKKSLEEHKAIVEAVKNRDLKQAEALTNRHVKNTSKNVLKRKLEKIAEYVDQQEE